MGNTKLYAFDGTLRDNIPDRTTEAEIADLLSRESRGYVTVKLEKDGYLGQGLPWIFGTVHSYSMVATPGLISALKGLCSEHTLVFVDLDQVPFGGGVYLQNEQSEEPIEFIAHKFVP